MAEDYLRFADHTLVDRQNHLKTLVLLKICRVYGQLPYREVTALPITPDSLASGGDAALQFLHPIQHDVESRCGWYPRVGRFQHGDAFPIRMGAPIERIAEVGELASGPKLWRAGAIAGFKGSSGSALGVSVVAGSRLKSFTGATHPRLTVTAGISQRKSRQGGTRQADVTFLGWLASSASR